MYLSDNQIIVLFGTGSAISQGIFGIRKMDKKIFFIGIAFVVVASVIGAEAWGQEPTGKAGKVMTLRDCML